MGTIDDNPGRPAAADIVAYAPPPAEQAPAVGRIARSPKWEKVLLWAAASWLCLLVVAAIIAPVLPLTSPDAQDYNAVSVTFSSAHLLGADSLGRDILSRLIFGARVSLGISLAAVVLGLLIGGALGLLSGYFAGSRADRVLLILSDSALAFPGLVLALAVVAIIGPGLVTLLLALAALAIPAFFRLTRANTLKWSKREFVAAAKGYGSRGVRVVMRDILPNVLPPVSAYAFIMIGTFIVIEGSLSFLGLGIPPPTPSWGGMIAQGKAQLLQYPHIVLVPAIWMCLTVLSINYIGEKIRDRYEIKAGHL